ncbi:MAG: phosphoglucosamine mutase [Thermoplasmata archaeon]|nr:phosphoglucosamine mutase [Thermoplasmata archaeon]
MTDTTHRTSTRGSSAAERANAPSVPRLFGTDGIRKIVGKDITPTFVAEAAAAFAGHLGTGGLVLVAHDYRTTSPAMARIVAGVLSMAGINVQEIGAMPTPCLQFSVREAGARAGMMITASHNPTDFNGIKICGHDGLEISRLEEIDVETRVYNRQFPSVPWDQAGEITWESNCVARYLESISHLIDGPAVARRRAAVVLDCGNGTSAATSPRLLRSLGCKLTTLNSNPDGHFPGHPSEPKEENLKALMATVVDTKSDLGVAHDGDSDRVAFIDETGRFVPGEEALALLVREMLRSHPGGTIVTSVTSTQAVEEVVANERGKLIITRSGSLPVARGIVDNHAIFGGEENGGYYWPTHHVARDGPASSAMMLDILARTGKSLSQLLDELPRIKVVKHNVPLDPLMKEAVMQGVQKALEAEAERVDPLDGVKAFYSDGRLLVRPSGTEPLCRIYGESKDPERAHALARRGVQMVESLQHTAITASDAATRHE